MTTLYVDTETRSRVDLRKSTVYKYVECPDFKVLMTTWALGDDPVQVALTRGDMWAIPWEAADRIVAHNASFDRVVLEAYLGRGLPLELWDDTQARAGEHGYPQGLDNLARALGATPKDTAGTRLINLFSKPNSRTGQFVEPKDKPVQWQEFIDYGVQDTETLREVDGLLPGWPTEAERRTWLVDQQINDRGFAIDVDLAEAAIQVAEENRLVQELEVMRLAGIRNPGSTQQLLPWLQQHVSIPNLQAETIEQALQNDPPQPARRVLELRQELAMSAYKKYTAAVNSVSQDGRLRGGFRFFGAHTGRWTGRGMQPHNLPREQLSTETATDAAILDLKMGLGASAYTLKALVRALITGPLTVVDYSAIEARVIAWLAGEQWALDAFAAGRDIYVETAERMSTPDHKFTRSQGKVTVLALGYNGGIRSLRNMGADGTDDELQTQVHQWRGANPAIVRLWKTLENAFIHGGSAGRLMVERDGKDRAVVLPSGRAIVYHRCARGKSRHNPDRTVISFADPRGAGRVETYGGKLSENVTQAVARDILAHALVNLADKGYSPVSHVHDEIITEGEHPVEDIVKLMCDTPDWAEGLPINAEGFVCSRYRKG